MKDLMVSFRAILIFVFLTGVLYPLSITLVGKAFFASKANGSLITQKNEVVGSELIGQEFKEPKYFWGRPSSVKYDASLSGASNLGPTSKDLIKMVREREAHGAVADLRYSSASGLDPDISPEAASSQIKRVAMARGVSPNDVATLVRLETQERQFGFLGEERVNVLLLNLALDKTFSK